jgi:hypothetical protein
MARCKNTDMLMSSIKKAGGGKVQTSADTARKLATQMGGMKKGGRIPRESTSQRPTTASGRPITMAELNAANRDTGGMTAAEIKAAGEAIARGNREPYEPMPPKPIRRAQGGAAKVRKGMMSPSGQILQAVKPKRK